MPHDKVEYVISSFDNYAFPENKFDLVSAQFSLPFNSPQDFNDVFNNIIKSLKAGGIFVGQLFGERDQWNNPETGMTFHTREQVEELLKGLEVLELKEEEKDEKPVVGDIKHWHIFHIIARKSGI